jgi:hypothetical protein
MTAPRADHAGAERPDRRLVREMISVQLGAVAAVDRAAIDKQIPAAMAANVAQRVTGSNVPRFCAFIVQ